ncbi:hypothetical protein TanjilG_00730 [Lupinus angustifolius]|uniref:Protein kinase domain-containing protein n=1 Tax=Lupinus angustifolius TaxID=3871 RepID=A0A4P1R7N6_LUPAN|nr:hypothetical protein TanjilG_00730 [Lupinus angustifolius]
MAVAAIGQLNLTESPTRGSRSIDCFEKLEQIGEGTYGQVYMAKEIKTGEIVALKRIRMDNEREGFPMTALREIKILQKLDHENVIKLKEIVTSPDANKYKGGIYMVFEYMDHDLTGLADRPGMRFTVPQIKCYMKQLLMGLHYCHLNHVLHRDIKGSNLLIDNEGNLKLADFGLARSFPNDRNANLTNRVITLWYRPPELLLGATKYGTAVDMWSVGCILGELLNGKPIFQGKDESEQLNKIFELCGAPDEVIWPGVSKLPWYNQFKPTRPMKRRLSEVFKHFDHHALELLETMLALDPAKQSGQHAQMRPGPNQQAHGAHQVHPGGPGHHYGNPQGPSGGPGRYPPGANPGGGYNHPNHGGQGGEGGYGSGPFPPQARGAPFPPQARGAPFPPQVRGAPFPPQARGAPFPPQGGGDGGFGVGAPNYTQQGPYGGSAAGRGSNMGGNGNQES